jgi:hypothetical protein
MGLVAGRTGEARAVAIRGVSSQSRTFIGYSSMTRTAAVLGANAVLRLLKCTG